MTTRITKSIAGTYTAQSQGYCSESILTFQECFQAAANLIGDADARHSFVNHTISRPAHPAGCSVAMDPSAPLVVHVYFNKLKTSGTKCAAGAKVVTGTTAWGAADDETCTGDDATSFPVNATGVQCSDLQHQPATTADACAKICCGDNRCDTWCINEHKGCWTGVAKEGVGKCPKNKQELWIGGQRHVSAPSTGPPLVEVSVTLNATSQLAEITIQGEASVWFGVGFGAHAMGDLPWTLVADGNGQVSERKLGNHVAGSTLKPSVQVLSNTVDSKTGLRTVVVSRPLQGATGDYFTFSTAATDATIPIIVAVGSGPEFGYHKNKSPTSITLIPIDGEAAVGSCVCPQQPKPFGEATGELLYHAVANQSVDVGTGAVGFRAHKCANWPYTDLMNNTNPTCDIRYYRGGQWSCHHMWCVYMCTL